MEWVIFGAGVYVGVGIGCVLWAVADVGFKRGISLLWRVPTVILFWPGIFMVAFAVTR